MTIGEKLTNIPCVDLRHIVELIEELGEPNLQKLKDNLLDACIKLQGNVLYRRVDEDPRNTFIAKAKGYDVRDQTRWGVSATGKQPGEIDLLVRGSDGRPFTIVECLNLDYLDTTKINKHITKVFNYDPNGLQQNFVVVYASAKDFPNLWEKYWRHVVDFEYDFLSPILLI